MTDPDTTAVTEVLGVVAATQAKLDATCALLARQTQALADEVALLGMEMHSLETTADSGLIRRLYWGAPSLHNQVVYQAFGLRSPNDVSTIAGPTEFDMPCDDCGVSLRHNVKNRTELAKLRATNRCEPCAEGAEDRERQRRAELEATWRRRNHEGGEIIRRAMQAYVVANPDLPEEPSGASMYVDIPVPEWGGTTVRLRDLNEVREQFVERFRR